MPVEVLPNEIEQLVVKSLNNIHNARLRFYRYADAVENSRRGSLLRTIAAQVRFDELQHYRQRLGSAVRALETMGYRTCSFQGRLLSRLACGLGVPSPFENGLTLHHIHGFPYVPGSSLKGVVQDYAIFAHDKSFTDPDFRAVFGEQDENKEGFQGCAVFFDALPVAAQNTQLLYVDVMTPHYGDYYELEDHPPADWLDPNPIYFLTVKEGTTFEFFLAARDYRYGSDNRDKQDVLNNAKNWLKGALSEFGAGGKTAVGYGLFKFLESQ